MNYASKRHDELRTIELFVARQGRQFNGDELASSFLCSARILKQKEKGRP